MKLLITILLSAILIFMGCDTTENSNKMKDSNITKEPEISSFTFETSTNNILKEPISCEIFEDTISAEVPSATDLSSLIASFEANGKVTVDGEEQESGKNSHNFFKTVTYTVEAEGKTTDYTVTIYANRSFWAVNATLDYSSNKNAWYEIKASKKAEGEYCQIYLENGQNVSYETILSLQNEFDTKIWPAVNKNFASPTDIDGNGKVILLLMDIIDGYNEQTNPSYIGGYFFGVDLYAPTELTALDYPSFYKTNQAEMLYIDVNPNDPLSDDFKSTVAHEFQHLVNMSQNIIAEGGNFTPVWIDEGFATMAEAVYQDVDILEARELWYNNDPLLTGSLGIAKNESYSIAYGYPLVIWNPYPQIQTAVLNNYALSHMFFAWLRIHMGTDSFFKDIINSPDNTFQSVVDICSTQLGPKVDTPEEMISKFYMANLLGANKYNSATGTTTQGKTTGLESYLGKNKHYGPFSFGKANEQQIKLLPGAAVHFANTEYNNWTPPDGGDTEIIYELGNRSTDTADYEAPFGTGDDTKEVVIVLNGQSTGYEYKTTAVLPKITTNSDNVLNSRPDNTILKRSNGSSSFPIEVFRKGLEPR